MSRPESNDYFFAKIQREHREACAAGNHKFSEWQQDEGDRNYFDCLRTCGYRRYQVGRYDLLPADRDALIASVVEHGKALFPNHTHNVKVTTGRPTPRVGAYTSIIVDFTAPKES